MKFNKNKNNKKYKLAFYQAGMTYAELIVVLSIFSVMSAIVLFNYAEFQARVDIKNLANDIALKIVEAQKTAISGGVPVAKVLDPTWKPSYGIHFNTTSLGSNVDFIYFADLDQNYYDSDTSFCSSSEPTYECISKINITKGNYISNIIVYYPNSSNSISDLSLGFRRPNSGTTLSSNGSILSGATYVEITISSPQNITSNIKVYASGRIQIN